MGQFVALYTKNLKYWGKNICGSICEFVCPLIFALFLIAIASLSEDKSFNA